MSTEKVDIEQKIRKVKNNVTSKELDQLKDEMGCLSPEKIAKLRSIIEAKKAVREETKAKLRALLVECESNPKIPAIPESKEVSESKESFGQVFEGAKSDMLSKEHILALKAYILSKFKDIPNLSESQKDNLAVATVDRLLGDADFSGLVGKLGGSLTSAIKGIEKSGVSGVIDALSDNTKEEEKTETKTEVENTMTGAMKRIADLVDRATTPLVELIKKKPAGLEGFLSNPRVIAKYDGSGNIPTETVALTSEEKTEYIKNLNNRILEVDGKIISLEKFREKGMDMVATAPDWMQKIFKWILELPFIGNLLASFLGYKDGAEALGLMDEEFRQRKSIVTLREFGKKKGLEGKESDGKYSGKIGILKGMDLSGLNHKRLKDFFQFTKDVGIGNVTPEIWISLFEKGELSVKNAEGKDVVYKLTKPLSASDTEKDFSGLYRKLNELLSIKNNTEYQAKQKDGKQKKSEQDAEKKRADEESKQKTLADAALKSETQKRMKPYRDISEGVIINSLVAKKLSTITLADFMDGKYQKKAESLLRGNKNKDQILAVLTTYSSILSDPKMEGFRNNLKSGSNGKDVNFGLISFQRKNMLIVFGTGVPESVPSVAQTDKSGGGREVSGKITQVPETTSEKPKEAPKDTKTVLAEAFTEATSFPIVFEDNGKKQTVDFRNNELLVGEMKFSLGVKGNGLAALAGTFSVDGLGFNGENVKLSFNDRSANIPRATIAEGIGAMLAFNKNDSREIAGESGKLIITRVV